MSDQFIKDFDIHQGVADQAFDNVSAGYIASWANDTAIVLTATATGDTLNHLTAGALTVYYSYVLVD